MELTNAVVIYFAFGVPFGILSAYLRTSRLESIDVFRVIYHLSLWPLILLTRAFGVAMSIRHAPIPSPKIQDRNADRTVRAQRMIRDGLIEAHDAALSAAELRLPFEDAIQHPNPALAAKCFHRRNIKRLERLALQAQMRFEEISIGLGTIEQRNAAALDGSNLEATDPRTVLS